MRKRFTCLPSPLVPMAMNNSIYYAKCFHTTVLMLCMLQMSKYVTSYKLPNLIFKIQNASIAKVWSHIPVLGSSYNWSWLIFTVYTASKIHWTNGHCQWFSDSGHQIITKLQCNLQCGQWIFKSIVLRQNFVALQYIYIKWCQNSHIVIYPYPAPFAVKKYSINCKTKHA